MGSFSSSFIYLPHRPFFGTDDCLQEEEESKLRGLSSSQSCYFLIVFLFYEAFFPGSFFLHDIRVSKFINVIVSYFRKLLSL